MIRAVIIDDENGNIRYLEGLLKEYCSRVSVVATFNGVAEAAAFIAKEKIELVFLDVELNNELGFKLLESFPDPPFEVIFITAHEKYALSAIKASCLEYLLKPVNHTELIAAIEKFEKQKKSQANQKKIEMLLENVAAASFHKIAVPSNEGYSFVSVNDIVCCEASTNYTIVYTAKNEKLTSTRGLKEFEELLPKDVFFRCHKSWLVSLNFVKNYNRNDMLVTMSNGMKIDVAVRKKEEFIKLFEKF
ncbi:MAG: LytR/AlgR family response regulator transcription factor [Bacteroidia bacterium]